MKKKFVYLILLVIFSFSLFIRLYKLGQIPPGLNWDEASNGYRAHVLLKTGANEWGIKLPLFSKHIGDYRAEIYPYLSIIPIKIFGLTVLATRFVSALAGGVAALFFYFLIKNLLLYFKVAIKSKDVVALFASFILSINPWNIHLSRQASEANIAFTFTIIGLSLFYIFLNKRKYIYLFLCSWFCIISIYAYHSQRLVLPLFFAFFLTGKSWKAIFQNKKKLFVIFIFSFILVLPLVFAYQRGVLSYRPKIVSIFNDHGRRGQLVSFGLNKFIYYGEEVVRQTIRQFCFRWLFLGENYNLRFGTKRYGGLLYVDLLMLVLGIGWAMRKNKKMLLFLIYWLIIAALPAGLTNESPHALRGYLVLIGFLAFVSMGFSCLVEIKEKLKRNAAVIIIVFLYLFNFYLYFNYYLTVFPKNAEYDWQVFYRPAMKYVSEKERLYDKILFTDKYLDPHIFL